MQHSASTFKQGVHERQSKNKAQGLRIFYEQQKSGLTSKSSLLAALYPVANIPPSKK